MGDVIPQVSVPQPAQGLPNQMPGQPDPSQLPDPSRAPASSGGANPFAALAKSQPNQEPEEQPVDQSNPFASLAKSKPGNNPFAALSKAESNYPPKDNSAQMPLTDVAKAHMYGELSDQAKALNKINPKYNARVDNQEVTVEINGKRLPMDSESPGIFKALAQHSGDITQFATTILPGMATDGLLSVGEIPGIAKGVIHVLEAPFQGATGSWAKNYLAGLWGKVKPDPVSARRDLVIAAAGGSVFAALGAVAKGGYSIVKNAFGSKQAEDAVAKGVSTMVHGATGINPSGSEEVAMPWTNIGRGIVNSRYQNPFTLEEEPLGHVDSIIRDLNSRFDPLTEKALVNSPNGKIQDSKGTLKKVLYDAINRKAPGAVSWSEAGVPSIKNMQQTAVPLNNGGQVSFDPASHAFGVPGEGQRALETLVNDYRKIMASDATGGMPYNEFNQMVKSWQEDSQFNQFRSNSYTGRSITSSFKQAQHMGAEMRMQFLVDNLNGEDQRAAKQLYRDYSSKIGPAQALVDLFNSSNESPEIFARALLKPQNANTMSGLKYLMQDYHPQVFEEIRSRYITDGMEKAIDPNTGKFDVSKLIDHIDAMGEQNKETFFRGRFEYEKFKKAGLDLTRYQNAKAGNSYAVDKLTGALMNLNPASNMVMRSGSFLDRLSQKNPKLWQAVADRMAKVSTLSKDPNATLSMSRWLNDNTFTRSLIRAKEGAVGDFPGTIDPTKLGGLPVSASAAYGATKFSHAASSSNKESPAESYIKNIMPSRPDR